MVFSRDLGFFEIVWGFRFFQRKQRVFWINLVFFCEKGKNLGFFERIGEYWFVVNVLCGELSSVARFLKTEKLCYKMFLGVFGTLSEGGGQPPEGKMKCSICTLPPPRSWVLHEREKAHFLCLKVGLWGLIVGLKRLIAKKKLVFTACRFSEGNRNYV